MTKVSLSNSRTGESIADSVMLADSFWLRLRGLLKRPQLKPGEGLWLTPCKQVHMKGMRYPLSIWFIDTKGEICHIIDSLEPNKISPKVREAHSVLEFPAGWAKQSHTQCGDFILQISN